MPNTLGYHLVKSAHGVWLPGDDRGHWSSAWDDQLGYIEPHQLHAGDPVRLRMARERMKHPPVRFAAEMMRVMAETIGRCAAESPWRIAAASIEPTHMHLLMTYSGLDIERTAKWLAQQTTKAVHQQTSHIGPVWCEGSWRGFVFDTDQWRVTQRYIERHNERRGVGACPYEFVDPHAL
ncbi:MAG: transposase [Phycisphaeraceae bacterium]